MHVGAGRTGFSTGLGPVSFYQSLGGGGRGYAPRRSQRLAYGLTVTEQRRLIAQARAAEKANAVAALSEVIDRLQGIHRDEFPPAMPPHAPLRDLPSLAELTEQYERAAKNEVAWHRRKERNEAVAQARLLAVSDHARLMKAATVEQEQDQAELDELWASLCRNDPDVVLGTLSEALADNEATSVVVSVMDGEATLLILAPSIDVVPERRPGLTAAGNPSMTKMTKSERATIYSNVVMGHVLVTAKECFAVAPALQAARIVVLRVGRMDSYGRTELECIAAGRWERRALEGIDWSRSAAEIAHDSCTELLVRVKSVGELQALDLQQEPELAALVSSVEFRETMPDDMLK